MLQGGRGFRILPVSLGFGVYFEAGFGLLEYDFLVKVFRDGRLDVFGARAMPQPPKYA